MDFYENVLWIQGARRSARIGASVYAWHTLQRVRWARMKSDRRAIRRPHVHFGASDRRAMGSEHPIGARPDAPCIHFGASDRRAIIHIHDRCLHSAAPPLQCLANIMGPDLSLRFPEREAGIFTVCLYLGIGEASEHLSKPWQATMAAAIKQTMPLRIMLGRPFLGVLRVPRPHDCPHK